MLSSAQVAVSVAVGDPGRRPVLRGLEQAPWLGGMAAACWRLWRMRIQGFPSSVVRPRGSQFGCQNQPRHYAVKARGQEPSYLACIGRRCDYPPRKVAMRKAGRHGARHVDGVSLGAPTCASSQIAWICFRSAFAEGATARLSTMTTAVQARICSVRRRAVLGLLVEVGLALLHKRHHRFAKRRPPCASH